ncbi:GTPase ObgE [Clostridium cylindrosporum]|uniref:GTPase Obg n=1 Tax=Clostridium cylindrosporum DSM 605 TaxID=1121307 RepID=A0A0J8DB93_CLOCY|nr:GTPase ObgE [Clostridium cylindrosporum]KMT21553.1 GTPase Obg [Clostridium cylindrosporum DSM 605]
MFIDIAKIYIKAGDGGHGSASFRREKYVPLGGPDGGDGGDGGSVIFKVDPGLRTLLDFKYKRKHVAERGEDGASQKMYGRAGKDLVIKVPPGTVIKEAESGKIIADLKEDGEQAVVARGGRGGKGNAKFATSTRQAPNFAQPGLPGEERNVVLELKLLADVGLVGFPNVGKSTMLSMVTGAKPKIANYHFTTLTPNLGVVDIKGIESFVLADIPGLIEGAHEGVGLGIDFLRHVERTRLLIHVIDVSGVEGRDPIDDFEKINDELKLYNEKLSKKPQIVVANKTDIAENEENYEKLKEYVEEKGMKIFKISAATNTGLRELMLYVGSILNTIEVEEEYTEDEMFVPEERKFTYDVEIDEEGVYVVSGSLVDRLLLQVNIYDSESIKYFHRTLERRGIIAKLKEMGIQDNDLVRMDDFEFEFLD